MKKVSLLILVLLSVISVWAQSPITIDSQIEVNTCNISIYDDGGLSGNYLANKDYVLTIRSIDYNRASVSLEIVTLDIHPSDTLYIYDGDNTNSEVLAKINNNSFATGRTDHYVASINNASGALTIRFKSDDKNEGEGFVINTSCSPTCQRVELSIDESRSSHLPKLDAEDGYQYIDVCPYDTVHLVINCNFPDNDRKYHQDIATTSFKWNMDLETFEELGKTEMDYYFTSGRGYDITISATDGNQCYSTAPLAYRVRTSKNPIKNIAKPPVICQGDDVEFTAGHDNISVVQLDSIGSKQKTSMTVQELVFLPDGQDCPPYGLYYRSYVNFNSFAPDAKITSADDILYVRLKMEHSAIEDIRISLICPNGNVCKIVPDFQYDGWDGMSHKYFRMNLGVAYRPDVVSCESDQNPQGTPWNYVWSNNVTLGYRYANSPNSFCYEDANVHYIENPHWDDGNYSYCIDSSNVAEMSQIYHPKQSFSGMIGCPLNGNWYIQVEDLWENDNGYLHEWELALDPKLLPKDWSYDVAVDSVYAVGPGAHGLIATPDVSGEVPYKINVVDEYGCVYDSSTVVTVVPTPKPDLGEDLTICDGDMYLLTPKSADSYSDYHWNTGDDTKEIYVLSNGDYILTVSEYNEDYKIRCTGSDTVHIDLAVRPDIDFALSDTDGCVPLTLAITDETTPEGDYHYDWGLMDNAGMPVQTSEEKSPTFVIETPGDYTFYSIVTAGNGCADSVYKWNFIHAYPQPVAAFEATPQTSMLSETGGSVFFNNLTDTMNCGHVDWLWDFDDGETDNQNFSVTHVYAGCGDYNVTLTVDNVYGCKSDTSIKVVIEDGLIFPNVITPNGDGFNDVFAIINLNTDIDPNDPEGFRSNKLMIYDRWGKQVYHAKNYDTVVKNGSIQVGSKYFDAANLPDGVYYFRFYYKGKAKTVDYNGSITVIR